MAEPTELILRLRQCFEQGRPPITEGVDAKLWFLALDTLIQDGALDEAAFVAPHLAASFPESAVLARLAMLLDRMPPAVADPEFAAFANRRDEPVQIKRRAGASAVLFAFGGRYGSLGIPIPIAHRWFGELDMHVVYLRDAAYLNGIPALGSDRAETIRCLKRIVTDLGATRSFCFGNSTGALAGLLYGLEMQAAAVLGIGAPTVPSQDMLHHHLTPSSIGGWTEPPDIARLYATAVTKPATCLVYAADNQDDAVWGTMMAGIQGVTLVPVPNFSAHDAHVALIERGQFGALLKDVFVGHAAGGSAG